MAAFCIAVTGLGWMVRIMRGHSDDCAGAIRTADGRSLTAEDVGCLGSGVPFLALPLEVREPPAADDPIGGTRRFVAEVRVRPPGLDALLLAGHIRELSIDGSNLV